MDFDEWTNSDAENQGETIDSETRHAEGSKLYSAW